jgi:hypothetical protein
VNRLAERGAPLPRPALSSWDIDEDLRHIERLLRRDRPRLEVPSLHLEGLPQAPAPAPAATPGHAKPASWLASIRSGFSWLFLCVGLAATVCGVILLVWHFLGARAELLTPGLICAAAGQFSLLGGFFLQPASAPAPLPSPSAEAAHPAAQWLEAHRRIDEILRADQPSER